MRPAAAVSLRARRRRVLTLAKTGRARRPAYLLCMTFSTHTIFLIRAAAALWLCVAVLLSPPPAQAEPMLLDTFEPPITSRWSYVADTVMGGRSTGRGELLSEDGESFARLTGTVSTANNGGFIQIRRALTDLSQAQIEGVRLRVRGNDQAYFIHLRTRQSDRPWAYYQAEFFAAGDWQDVTLPFEAFRPSTRGLPATFEPQDLISIGIVAYGRDHEAALDVSEVGFF